MGESGEPLMTPAEQRATAIATGYAVQTMINDIRQAAHYKTQEKMEESPNLVQLLNRFRPQVINSVINTAIDAELGKFLGFLVSKGICYREGVK